MKLSEIAWAQSSTIIDTIKQHPFNQQLMKGTLSRNTFAYYLEQDTLYLKDCARFHNLIAEKVSDGYKSTFRKYATETIALEQLLIHGHYKKHFKLENTNQTTPATHGYTNHLLCTVALEPIEIAIAAALPCFWIYRELGHLFLQHVTPGNPYAEWIQCYSDETFEASTQEAISIFDAVAESATDEVRQKMLAAFNKSMIWELHFWHDAYHHKTFNDPTELSMDDILLTEHHEGTPYQPRFM